MNSAFGTIMIIILALYGIYYAANIIKDAYFDRSGQVVAESKVEEHEVDIGDELKDFTKFNANDDDDFDSFAFSDVESKFATLKANNLPEEPSMSGAIVVDDFDKYDFEKAEFACIKAKAA